MIIGGGKSYRNSDGNYLDNAGEKPVFRDDLLAEFRRLIELEKLSIKTVSEKCSLALTTVRRVLRTLGQFFQAIVRAGFLDFFMLGMIAL